MTFDEQLVLLRGHCALQRALFIDDGVRSFEITLADGQFCLYKLHEYGHRFLGYFPTFAAAFARTLA